MIFYFLNIFFSCTSYRYDRYCIEYMWFIRGYHCPCQVISIKIFVIQVSDLYKEIQIILADCLFCLATQQPLGKADTLRLIQHLRADNCVSADGSLEPVSLCLLMTLLYCFDVTLLDQEDSKGETGILVIQSWTLTECWCYTVINIYKCRSCTVVNTYRM